MTAVQRVARAAVLLAAFVLVVAGALAVLASGALASDPSWPAAQQARIETTRLLLGAAAVTVGAAVYYSRDRAYRRTPAVAR